MFLSPQTQRNPQILLFLNDPTVTLILVSKMYDLATMGKSSSVIVRRLKALADHLHSILRVWEKTLKPGYVHIFRGTPHSRRQRFK